MLAGTIIVVRPGDYRLQPSRPMENERVVFTRQLGSAVNRFRPIMVILRHWYLIRGPVDFRTGAIEQSPNARGRRRFQNVQRPSRVDLVHDGRLYEAGANAS